MKRLLLIVMALFTTTIKAQSITMSADQNLPSIASSIDGMITESGANTTNKTSQLNSKLPNNKKPWLATSQPQDFIAPGNTADQLTSGLIDVGKIINKMITSGIRTIYLPCGKYKITSKVSLPNYSTIMGAGACSQVSIQTDGDIITATDAGYVRISSIRFVSDINRTTGSVIMLMNTYDSKIDHVVFDRGSGSNWNAIYLNGTNSTHIDAITGRGGNWDGIVITGKDHRSEDTYISNSSLEGYKGSGIEIIWSSGAYLMNLDILANTNGGIVIDPTFGEVDGLKASNVLSDSNIGSGWSFSGSGGIWDISLTNCWSATNGNATSSANGLIINNHNLNNLIIANSEFHSNYGAGIYIRNGKNININGNSIFQNSAGKSGDDNGITIFSEADYVMIIGNIIGMGPSHGNSLSVNYQKYGIYIDPSYKNHMTAIGNLTHGNMEGGVSIPPSPNIIQNMNQGD